MTDSANALVLLQREGAVAHIVLDRPEQLNVIDVGMARALLEVCGAVAGAAEKTQRQPPQAQAAGGVRKRLCGGRPGRLIARFPSPCRSPS